MDHLLVLVQLAKLAQQLDQRSLAERVGDAADRRKRRTCEVSEDRHIESGVGTVKQVEDHARAEASSTPGVESQRGVLSGQQAHPALLLSETTPRQPAISALDWVKGSDPAKPPRQYEQASPLLSNNDSPDAP